MANEMEIPVKLQIQETVDEFIYKAVEPFAETIIGKVTKEEMAQILKQGTRKGHWIINGEKCVCSACRTYDKYNLLDFRFCPHCGAKMEEVDE